MQGYIEGEQTEPLGASAYVVVHQAACLYGPDYGSAVSVTPPYGTIVPVVRTQGAWVLIGFSGKQAWALRQYLSSNPISARDVKVPTSPVPRADAVPLVRYTFNPAETPDPLAASAIEYGPRGGRYVRTASGFRRYF